LAARVVTSTSTAGAGSAEAKVPYKMRLAMRPTGLRRTALSACALLVSASVAFAAITPLYSNAVSSGLVNALVVKANPGTLSGFNCAGVAGAAAGYCIAYNGAAAPGTGALTAANVLDYCYFGTTPAGCSRNYPAGSIGATTGIVILVSSAASPYTYTTGTDTAGVTAQYN
jgi:hypothetical protein